MNILTFELVDSHAVIRDNSNNVVSVLTIGNNSSITDMSLSIDAQLTIDQLLSVTQTIISTVGEMMRNRETNLTVADAMHITYPF